MCSNGGDQGEPKVPCRRVCCGGESTPREHRLPSVVRERRSTERTDRPICTAATRRSSRGRGFSEVAVDVRYVQRLSTMTFFQ